MESWLLKPLRCSLSSPWCPDFPVCYWFVFRPPLRKPLLLGLLCRSFSQSLVLFQQQAQNNNPDLFIYFSPSSSSSRLIGIQLSNLSTCFIRLPGCKLSTPKKSAFSLPRLLLLLLRSLSPTCGCGDISSRFFFAIERNNILKTSAVPISLRWNDKARKKKGRECE